MNINWHRRELNLKIVYYGPALSGKTTNLEKIYARVNPRHRSEMVSLKTNEDRTLFFDFVQLEMGKIGGLTPKINLYTVPGQTYYEASRRLILRGVDGIVFVADSAEGSGDRNIQTWEIMLDHLEYYNLKLKGFPLVLQCNKQDLPNAFSTTILSELLHVDGIPVFPSIAIRGEGVFDTLKAITVNVMTQVQCLLV